MKNDQNMYITLDLQKMQEKVITFRQKNQIGFQQSAKDVLF